MHAMGRSPCKYNSFYDILSDINVIYLHLRFCIFMIFCVFLGFIMRILVMSEWMLEWMVKNGCNWMNEWMYEWTKKIRENRVSVSSGFLHGHSVS